MVCMEIRLTKPVRAMLQTGLSLKIDKYRLPGILNNEIQVSAEELHCFTLPETWNGSGGNREEVTNLRSEEVTAEEFCHIYVDRMDDDLREARFASPSEGQKMFHARGRSSRPRIILYPNTRPSDKLMECDEVNGRSHRRCVQRSNRTLLSIKCFYAAWNMSRSETW